MAGDTIEITDSGVYIETVGGCAVKKANITIMASTGQTPVVIFTYANAVSPSINPNVDGFKFGSNAGGQITVCKTAASPYGSAFGTYNLPAGAQMTLENLKFTSKGPASNPGPWNGQFLFNGIINRTGGTANVNNCQIIDVYDNTYGPFMGSAWGGSMTTNITNCTFDQTTTPTALYAIADQPHSTNSWNISNCQFINQSISMSFLSSPSANITSCYFTQNQSFCFFIDDQLTTATAPTETITINNCAVDCGGAFGLLVYRASILPRLRSITAISLAPMVFTGTWPILVNLCVLMSP